MSMVPGGPVPSFRVLLVIMDVSPMPRKGDGSDSFRVTRRCACAIRSEDDTSHYNVTLTGSQTGVLRLLSLGKQTCIHAIVSWRSEKVLALSHFLALPPDELRKFTQFFKKETQIYHDMMTNSDEALQIAPDETPLTISSRASLSTQASPWTSRKRPASLAFDDP